MSFLKNLRSAFPREKPTEASAAEAPAESREEPVPTVAEPPNNVIYIYSHGFTNGVFRIEPDKADFERFLEFCNKSDRIKEQQVLNNKAIAEIEKKLNEAKNMYAADREIIVEKEKQAENLSTSINEWGQLRLKMDEKELTLITKKNETIPEYPWIPALLYMCAGITFIAADISITKQITSWGFNMSGSQGWIFAIGLAFTTFLIKPTIDRILEKPFQAGGLKLKALYKGVLLAITTLGLVMLWVLGTFRSDSERARMKLDALTSQMALIDPNSADYRTLQSQFDDVQRSLDENSRGQTGLVLSGLLFAIGGAVCLSVSFGSLNLSINRYWILPARIGHLRRKLRAISSRIDGVRADHTLLKTEQEKAEKRLLASEMPQLREGLNKLHDDQTVLLVDFYEAQYERERALFLDGRSRGEKYQLDGELIYKASGNDNSPSYAGRQNGVNEGQSAPSIRPYTRRPFIKMRKMIADNFNKTQNNQTYDGTEFEIVS